MRVAHGVHVRAALVHEQMHGQLGAGVAAAGKFFSVHVGDHKIVGRHHALADRRGRSEHALVVEADGDVAVGGGNEAAGVNPAADGADIAAVLVFGLERAVRNGFRQHASGTSNSQAATVYSKTRFPDVEKNVATASH